MAEGDEQVKQEALQIIGLFQEIYSSWTHKTDHCQKIHQKTNVPFNSMLFFDDEDNIQSVSKMGVTSVLVNNGVYLGTLCEGLNKYSQNLQKIEKNKQQ